MGRTNEGVKRWRKAFRLWKLVIMSLLSGPLMSGVGSPEEVTNSLGQRFVSVPNTKVLFSVWETRNSDYRAFARSTGRKWSAAGANSGSLYPVVNVSWEDAAFFCAWLTEKERKLGKIGKEDRFRLPTSAEWSIAVGMKPVGASDPLSTTLAAPIHFPWEGDWPPPKGAGNYHPELGVDSYSTTAPVGSFAPNQFGLYDMGGNVWEWCQDPFKSSIDFRVLRGGSWRMRTAGDLLSSFEIGNTSHLRLSTYGFRVVLERGSDGGAQ